MEAFDAIGPEQFGGSDYLLLALAFVFALAFVYFSGEPPKK